MSAPRGGAPRGVPQASHKRAPARCQDATNWQHRGQCVQADPELFFSTTAADKRKAVRTCRQCDVRQQCLAYALIHGERHGIWGGLSEEQRKRIRKGAA